MSRAHKILLVDDEEYVRQVIRTMLESFDFEVVEAVNGLDGLEVFKRERPDLVFTDLMMPVMDGMAFIARLRSESPDTPIIVISGAGNIQSAVDAIRIGAWDYVTKPVEALDCLDIAVQRVLERARLIAENRAYQEHLEDLVMLRTTELHDSEARYRTLYETANDAIILLRNDCIVSCNPKAREMFGYNQDELLGRPLTSFSAVSSQDAGLQHTILAERMQRALSGAPQFFEWQHAHSNGLLFDAEISLNRLELRGLLYLQAIMRDITGRKKSQQALLDNIRIKQELDMAREIQQSLLPVNPPEISGIQIACRCLPAASVGGDYYDFFPVDEKALDVVISDVAGHSFGSALLMMETRSVLRAKVNIKYPPAELIGMVNDLLYEDLSRAELLISMFYLRLHVATGRVSYANAGHTRPLLIHARDGSFEELDAEGLLFGVMEGVEFEERTMQLSPGDLLLLHTDGISESENSSGEFFGTERIVEIVRHHHGLSPEDIIDALLQRVDGFTGGRALVDDVTLTVIKRL